MTKEQANQMVDEEYSEEEHKDPSGQPEAAAELAHEKAELSVEEQLQKELAETKDQWLRTVAEMENLRKRSERDVAEARKYALSGFAKDLTAVSENLHRALESITPDMLEGEENKTFKNLHMGVDMTRGELLRVFEQYGLKRIKPERGEAFDHNIHQAVSQVQDAEVAEGCVAQVIQAGYQLHDRLLQPAMVAVAKNTASA